MTAVIAALCFYLQKTVNEPHNPPRAKAGLRHQQGATSSTSSGGLSKTPSVVNLMRSERLSRAEELERSVPRSYKMALKSFAHCYAAIGVLDVLFARNSKVGSTCLCAWMMHFILQRVALDAYNASSVESKVKKKQKKAKRLTSSACVRVSRCSVPVWLSVSHACPCVCIGVCVRVVECCCCRLAFLHFMRW